MRFGPTTLSTIEPKWLRATMRWLTPLVASTVLYALAYAVSRWVFDVQIQWERVPYDFGLLLAIAYLLFWASRRIWAYLLLLTVLVGVAYIGSAAKITYLDRPIMPEDIYNVSALFRILGAWGWPIVALPLAAIAGLFLFNLRLTGRLRKTALSALFILPAGAAAESPMLYQAMDKFWGNTPWDQRENFVWRGATVHLTQELLRAVATRKPPPQADDVTAAIERRPLGRRLAARGRSVMARGMLTRRRLLNGIASGGALGLGALAALPSARAASSTLFGRLEAAQHSSCPRGILLGPDAVDRRRRRAADRSPVHEALGG